MPITSPRPAKLSRTKWLHQECLDDGRELLTIKMMLAPNLADEERENVVKVVVAVAIDALSDGFDDDLI